MNTYKLLPYGISDFRRIRKENYYYVDKSANIQRVEDVASFLFLIRPRRFGKSLFVHAPLLLRHQRKRKFQRTV